MRNRGRDVSSCGPHREHIGRFGSPSPALAQHIRGFRRVGRFGRTLIFMTTILLNFSSVAGGHSDRSRWAFVKCPPAKGCRVPSFAGATIRQVVPALTRKREREPPAGIERTARRRGAPDRPLMISSERMSLSIRPLEYLLCQRCRRGKRKRVCRPRERALTGAPARPRPRAVLTQRAFVALAAARRCRPQSLAPGRGLTRLLAEPGESAAPAARPANARSGGDARRG
ncbi:hypothetical protein EVAR_92712_1 [Eumeta japonica]|uniref:Uncharacterized protein n=1 Tax=Eumeta variegata TaxID=151549 RepID=A0A4C1SXV6_EUMVA|nr:hypothetical protein EVAR_92712_1 [Eumeta japonica]